ncbi:MAG: hypothetical protein IJD22_01550 [Clostridia bacterium]|nr:hypothetical protein [Clostridia bacterium]
MKNLRLDLQLFGEGGEGSAAEQSTAVNTGEENVTVGKKSEGSSPTESGPEPRESSYESIAELLGIEAESEEMLIDALKKRRSQSTFLEKLREIKAERAYSDIISEAERLSSTNEGFDLGRELSDSRFRALLNAGFTVEEAWSATHMSELMEKAKAEAKSKALAEALYEISLSASRPEENGSRGRAPAQSQTSVESLTGKGIRDILKRVANGAKIKF